MTFNALIDGPRKWGSPLVAHPHPAGNPESKGVTAGTGSTLERTGRRDPGPPASPGGAAEGTYNTLEPLPGAPPWTTPAAVTGTSWPSATITGRQRTGSRSAADQDRRTARSPGPSATPGPIPARNARLRGHLRGHGWSSGSQPPLPLRLPLPRDRRRGSRYPLAPLRLVACRRIHSPPFWAQSGAGSDPPPIHGSTVPRRAAVLALPLRLGGRSQPAPAARVIPAGRLPGRPAAGPGGGRRRLRRRRGPRWGCRRAGRQLADAAHGLASPLLGVLEPESLRRLVEGDLLRRGEVGGDHSHAPLLRAGTARGFGGCAPSVRCSGSGARGQGFEGERSIPSPVPLCTQRVGWPSCLST